MKKVFLVFAGCTLFIINYSFSQQVLPLKVNGKYFSIIESSVDSSYEMFLESLGRKHSKNKNEWDSDWITFKNNIKRCASIGKEFEFTVGSTRAYHVKVECDLTNEERGLTKDGKPAKSWSYQGQKKRANRFATIMYYFQDAVTRTHSSYYEEINTK